MPRALGVSLRLKLYKIRQFFDKPPYARQKNHPQLIPKKPSSEKAAHSLVTGRLAVL
jgi:hypothetical protein